MVFPNKGNEPVSNQAPEKRGSSPIKWFAVGLGGLIGLSHFAMIGMLVNIVHPHLHKIQE